MRDDSKGLNDCLRYGISEDGWLAGGCAEDECWKKDRRIFGYILNDCGCAEERTGKREKNASLSSGRYKQTHGIAPAVPIMLPGG